MNRDVAMVISNACAPDRRVLREAVALGSNGHRVTVIAWDREGSHPDREEVDGVKIERISVRSSYGTGLHRLASWPSFAWRALRRLRSHAWDAVHCHDLDVLPIGCLYTRGRAVPLVFDAHESYPDLVAPRLPRWSISLLRLMERHLVRRVEGVVTVGERLAAHYRAWAERVTVVRNCQLETSQTHCPAELHALFNSLEVDLLLCYIGGFTRGRVILPLLESVRSDGGVGMILVGSGPQKEAILEMADGCTRIAYLGPRVPRDQVVPIMRDADVVYYGLDAAYPNNRFSSPNALYGALQAGRPILTTDVGEIADIVQAEGCGIVLSNTDSRTFSAALDRLKSAAHRRRMSLNARRAYETTYNWDVSRANLLQLYRDLWEAR